MNSVKYYAVRDGINPRRAQRHREKLNIGQHVKSGGKGVWLISESDWKKIKKSMGA